MGKEARLVIRWLDVVVCQIIDLCDQQFIIIVKEIGTFIQPFKSQFQKQIPQTDLHTFLYKKNNNDNSFLQKVLNKEKKSLIYSRKELDLGLIPEVYHKIYQ